MNVKDFIPPAAYKLGALLRATPYGWSGNFPSWEAARSASTGYHADEILERVKTALLKVKNGTAAYERDSVLFDEIEYSWPLLAGLMWAAATSEGRLSVLDFGGSLGSTYFQNRRFLSSLSDIKWSVIEQMKFVECGKNHFEDETLRFYENTENCLREQQPNVFLFSCVLQYLESPYRVIAEALAHKPEVIIIDNMPFIDEPQRITVQRVHPQIYVASYPCWLLNKTEFINTFSPNYEMVAGFESHLSITVEGTVIPYEGFIFKKSKIRS